MNKPKRRIAIADTLPDFVEAVLLFVSHHYDFELTHDRNADYAFHSIDGYDVLKNLSLPSKTAHHPVT